jgi:Spy/CpxP family protein refolding chaperone
MTKVKATLLFAFILALSAGVVLGFAAARRVDPPGPTATKPAESRRDSWLSDQLKLSPEQGDQIREIWQKAMSEQGRANSERRRALEKERDAAVLALFTTEQRDEHDRLMAQYDARIAELGRERDRLRQEAIEKTKQVLTEGQRKKYEELLTERERDRERDRDGDRDRERDRERDRVGRGHRRGGSPATLPAFPATRPSFGAPAGNPGRNG